MMHDCHGGVIHTVPTAAYGVMNTMGARETNAFYQ
jgi:hypothetical protein